MHIKNGPVKGFKTECAGFELDVSKIELHSTNEREIHLPYTGLLPDGLQDNDGAVISVMPTVGLKMGISLIVTMNGKKLRYPVAATVQEANDILFSFFFEDGRNGKYHTRFGNGLNDYWLGHYQSSYTHWRRLVYEGHGVDELIRQLSPAALDRLEKYIEHTKTA